VFELQMKLILFQHGKVWFPFTCLILVCFLMNNSDVGRDSIMSAEEHGGIHVDLKNM